MSTEPDRDIEKLLKAYADKRRKDAGADMELHPATRRLLQGEVARLQPKTVASPARTGLLSGFWPRIAFAGSIFILLAIGTWTLLLDHSSPKTKLALAENRSVDKRRAISPTGTAAPAPAAKPESASPASGPDGAVNLFKSAPTSVENFSKTAEAKTLAGKDRDSNTYDREDMVKKMEIPSANAGSASSSSATPVTVDQLKTKNSPAEPVANDAVSRLAQVAPGSASGVSGVASPAPTASFKQQSGLESGTREPGVLPAAPRLAGDALALDSWAISNRSRTSETAPQLTASRPAESATFSLNDYGSGAGAPSGASTQHFARITQPTRALSSEIANRPQVLKDFSVERTGNRLRIIDSDGSAYYGFVNTREEAAGGDAFANTRQRAEKEKSAPGLAGTSVEEKTAAPARARAIQPDQSFSFRVSGTNLSLNQVVVFNGNLMVSTNLPPQKTTVGGALTGETKPQLSGGGISPELSARVQGQAVIDSTNRIDINAIPAKP